ncbi:MAG: tetratricopeptide repeat protein [Bacteroidales bacterium]
MKKLLTLVFIASAVVTLRAQEGASTAILLNYNAVQKKVEKSNEEIQDPKKGTSEKTWFKRGELFQDVFMLGLEQVNEGMAPTTLTLFYNEPENIETETIDGSLHETYNYEHMKYVFVDGALQQWIRVDPIVDDPLRTSMDAYIKALDLDEKGKLSDKIKEDLVELKNQLKRQGVNSYYKENYDKALQAFENVLEINQLDLFAGEFDTLMVQYSGIIARDIANKTGDKELYQKAIDYYTQLANAEYGGPNTYLQIKMDLMAIGDTVRALEVLKEAYEKYPDTVNVVANIADTYIQLDEIDEGLDFMKKVIEHSPNMAEAYYWNGRLLINKEESEYIEQAIESYKKAGELDPTIFYIWYDLGYIYYLQGADFYERAATEDDESMRDRLNELGKEKYEAAIPTLEKAFELNEENPSVKFETLDLLQRIYYKEQMMDDYNRVKTMKENM